MKKIIFILIGILVGVYMILSIITSGKEYAAERLMFRAARSYAKIRANPDVAPPGMLISVEKDLRALISRYPETPSGRMAHLSLAEIYASTEKYDEAIGSLAAFIAATKDDVSSLSRAHFLKAIAYEKLDNWDKALEDLKVLQTVYVGTPIGMQVPIYIAQHHLRAGDLAGTKEAFKEAVIFYQKIKEKEKGTTIGYMASTFMIHAYLGLEEYTTAGAALEDIIKNYSTDMTFMQIIPYIDMIFLEKLNDPEKAKALYRHILDKAVDGRLKNAVKGKIDAL